ncbi:MAG: hypothetical protein RBS55_08950 [Bacteroidales bacterium]|jgi:hypothetical protein|nr:hypothetical protein [Bacteroidales bacterium]
MKRVFILALTLLVNLTSNGQIYFPFPEENAYWTVFEYNQNLGMWDTYVYTITGDTAINDLAYKKIYQLNDTLEGEDTVWKFHACMRQEINNKRIFFIRSYLGETIEKLGYDFNVDIGDTISLPAFSYLEYDTLFKRLVTYDSVQLWNGEYRKHYFFASISESGYGLSVTEGISEYHSAFPNLLFWDTFHQSEVTCFRLNGEYLYGPAPGPTDCDFTVQVKDLSLNNRIICSPNPSKGLIEIYFPEINTEVYDLLLINTLGIPVLDKHIVLTKSTLVLDVHDLPSSCYLMLIKSGHLFYTNKMIINH